MKVLDDNGDTTFSSLIAGNKHAVDFAHVDVINLSLGGVGSLMEYRHLAEILYRTILYAAGHDVVVVSAK